MYLLFDIGGTKIRLAGSKDLKEFVDTPIVFDTPRDFAEAMKAIREAVSGISKGENIIEASGGLAGSYDKENDVLFSSPNLPTWNGKNVAKNLSKVMGTSIKIENDTAVVGLGEAYFGAGKGINSEILVYMTVSTGVGGVRIVDGSIDKNTFGFEPGHQVIDLDGSACSCNSPALHGDGPGHLDGYISGAATERRFKQKPYEITDPEVWDQLARWLAVGLNNTIVYWSPDTIVLGGSMIVGDPAIDINLVRRYTEQAVTIFPRIPKIIPAELKDLGGLYGAMALLSKN